MSVELRPELEARLRQISQQQSVTVADFVEQAVNWYLHAQGGQAGAWVRTTEGLLGQVWPREDFSAWKPPDAG